MIKFDIELTNKEDIKVGDTILCSDGNLRTVCRNNIMHDSFMGVCIFGDSYRFGHEKVKKVINIAF